MSHACNCAHDLSDLLTSAPFPYLAGIPGGLLYFSPATQNVRFSPLSLSLALIITLTLSPQGGFTALHLACQGGYDNAIAMLVRDQG